MLTHTHVYNADCHQEGHLACRSLHQNLLSQRYKVDFTFLNYPIQDWRHSAPLSAQ